MATVQSINSAIQIQPARQRTQTAAGETERPADRREKAYIEPAFSDSAKLFSALESSGYMSGGEMDSFREDLRRQVEDGTFDANEMARRAPDPIRELAENGSIDIEKAMTDIADTFGKIGYSADTAAPAETREPETGTDDVDGRRMREQEARTADNEQQRIETRAEEDRRMREQRETATEKRNEPAERPADSE